MDDKRDRLSELFDRAVALPADAREKLFEVCCDDPALRSELRSLLSAYDRAPNFLEALTAANGFGSAPIISAKVTHKDDGLPMIDQMYGHYRIEALVGTGGMGRVYRAWDTKLQRQAIVLEPWLYLHRSWTGHNPASSVLVRSKRLIGRHPSSR